MKSLKSGSVKYRVGLLSGLLTLIMLMVGGLSFKGSRELETDILDLSHVQMPAVRYMTLIDMYHDGIRANVYAAIVAGAKSDPKIRAEIEAEAKKFQAEISGNLEKLAKLPLDSSTALRIATAKSHLETYVSTANHIVDLALSGRKDLVDAELPTFRAEFAQLGKDLAELGDFVVKTAEEHAQVSAEHSVLIDKVILGTLICGFLLSCLLSWLQIQSISASLLRVSTNLQQEAKQVLGSSENITQAAEELAQSSTKQASALQETASSLEEIAAMAKKSAENAKASSAIASESRETVARGKQSADEMVLAVEDIDKSNQKIMSQVESGNRQITEIVKVIQEIGHKTKVINDIVFQTKLLSFNASVEAARAGEHGKGFAVVAEEVGNLAQMSGNAAKEIGDLLNGSIQKVEAIVADTKTQVERMVSESRKRVESGAQIARRCSESLDHVVKSITRVNEMTNEITTAAEEQTSGISEISTAMTQLDQVTHENASASQETAASSEALMERAAELMAVVAQVEDLIHGSKRRDGGAAAVTTDLPRNVVSLSPRRPPVHKSTRPVAQHSQMKKVAGGGFIPDESDPRFKDV